MAIRFRRSIKILPGLKLNVGKTSVGLSAGVRGAHVSINSKGRKTTSVGIPGTGLSYVNTSTINKKQVSQKTSDASQEPFMTAEEKLKAKYSPTALRRFSVFFLVFGIILSLFGILFLLIGLKSGLFFLIFGAFLIFMRKKYSKLSKQPIEFSGEGNNENSPL